MGPVTVYLAQAIICFSNACHPILYGNATPTGTFQLVERKVTQPGYDGSILQFQQDSAGYVWAIHRVWTRNPNQMRMYRISTPQVSDNRITNGCINVMPDVYYDLLAHYSNAQLTILP
jgi:hypothetical protein